MCYHYTFDPSAPAACLVMQEGKKARSDRARLKPAGMVIRTDGEDLFAARKKAVENTFQSIPGLPGL